MDISYIEEKLKSTEVEFNALAETIQKCQQVIAESTAKQHELRGAFATLTEMKQKLEEKDKQEVSDSTAE